MGPSEGAGISLSWKAQYPDPIAFAAEQDPMASASDLPTPIILAEQLLELVKSVYTADNTRHDGVPSADIPSQAAHNAKYRIAETCDELMRSVLGPLEYTVLLAGGGTTNGQAKYLLARALAVVLFPRHQPELLNPRRPPPRAASELSTFAPGGFKVPRNPRPQSYLQSCVHAVIKMHSSVSVPHASASTSRITRTDDRLSHVCKSKYSSTICASSARFAHVESSAAYSLHLCCCIRIV